jgi:hypothetical protein
MIFSQSIRQGDKGRCGQNGSGGAEKWTSVSPCRTRDGRTTSDTFRPGPGCVEPGCVDEGCCVDDGWVAVSCVGGGCEPPCVGGGCVEAGCVDEGCCVDEDGCVDEAGCVDAGA